MSKVKFVPETDPKTSALIARLTQEYLSPREGEVEPLLMELVNKRRSNTVHLYVIWQDWEYLDQRERAEIIMEAYESARGTENALRVTVAMGLTKAEAKRMKIGYEVENAA